MARWVLDAEGAFGNLQHILMSNRFTFDRLFRRRHILDRRLAGDGAAIDVDRAVRDHR